MKNKEPAEIKKAKEDHILKTKVSDQWKMFLERNTISNTFSEAVKMEIPELEQHSIRLTHSEIYQIEQLAKINSCTFDDVVNDLLKMVYDCRSQIKKMKTELLNNLPQKLDSISLAGQVWTNKTILFDKKILNMTCLIGRKRVNDSNGEMPAGIYEFLPDGSRVDFSFFVGPTIRIALRNYELFRKVQTILKVSKEKHNN